jgi:uncharacterized integral membrane protein (TIGR00698 family)
LYPLLTRALGMSAHEAGIFVGATIHDVAQVIGAGYTISKDAGDTATIVKLLRVAMLLPIIFIITFAVQRQNAANASADNTNDTKKPPLLPWFVMLFGIFVVINSLVTLPSALLSTANEASRFLLVVAIAAIGMKTQLRELMMLGLKPALMMLAETVFLATFVLVALRFVVR